MNLPPAVSAAFSQVEAASGDKAAIDIENATLAQVQAHNETMNANVAELIIELDKVTAGFSEQFNAMRDKIAMEKLVGFFSSAKADSLRETRVREANIDAKTPSPDDFRPRTRSNSKAGIKTSIGMCSTTRSI